VCFLWQYSLLNKITKGCSGFTYNQTYSCEHYSQLNYNELSTNLDDQPRVKTLPLKALFNEALNCKYYVLSMVERYLEEKKRSALRNILSECQFIRHKLGVKWYKIETRYSAVGRRRLTAWYMHGTAYMTTFLNG
jgi:hypothetical protein